MGCFDRDVPPRSQAQHQQAGAADAGKGDRRHQQRQQQHKFEDAVDHVGNTLSMLGGFISLLRAEFRGPRGDIDRIVVWQWAIQDSNL